MAAKGCAGVDTCSLEHRLIPSPASMLWHRCHRAGPRETCSLWPEGSSREGPSDRPALAHLKIPQLSIAQLEVCAER